MVMQFPAMRNAGCPKAPRDFPSTEEGISPSGSPGTPLPLPRVCRDVRQGGGAYADVRANFSYINRLPDFLTNGASRAGFAILSSAKKRGKRSKSTPVKLCRHFCSYVL